MLLTVYIISSKNSNRMNSACILNINVAINSDGMDNAS